MEGGVLVLLLRVSVFCFKTVRQGRKLSSILIAFYSSWWRGWSPNHTATCKINFQLIVPLVLAAWLNKQAVTV